MVAFIGGPLHIKTIAGSANLNFGGALFITPKNVSKNFLGSGGGHTAVVSFNFTGPSSTNTIDSDLVDQPVVLDN
jgi:spore germination protein PF